MNLICQNRVETLKNNVNKKRTVVIFFSLLHYPGQLCVSTIGGDEFVIPDVGIVQDLVQFIPRLVEKTGPK